MESHPSKTRTVGVTFEVWSTEIYFRGQPTANDPRSRFGISFPVPVCSVRTLFIDDRFCIGHEGCVIFVDGEERPVIAFAAAGNSRGQQYPLNQASHSSRRLLSFCASPRSLPE